LAGGITGVVPPPVGLLLFLQAEENIRSIKHTDTTDFMIFSFVP
jgi:hypothetical protein